LPGQADDTAGRSTRRPELSPGEHPLRLCRAERRHRSQGVCV